jgi:ribonuclease T2
LKEVWINIEKNTPLDSFWKHEWEKHGTCAAPVVKQLNNELRFFQQGIEFLKRYSITKLLSQTYIKPGTDVAYPLEEIHSAIKRSIDNNFAIVCKKDKNTKLEYLFEIRICFDKQLNLHSCDGIVMEDIVEQDPDPKDDIITNCKKGQDIVYPSSSWLNKKRMMKQLGEKRFVNSWVRHVVNAYKTVRLLQWITL